jgi:hypothetical protein
MTNKERLAKLICESMKEQGDSWSFSEIADYLIENGVIVPPCKVGDEVWVVEEDDVTCYMFLAKSKGCIIATSWINDYDVDETLEYHITETQDNLDTDLAVFPDECCFATKEEAEKALKGGRCKQWLNSDNLKR